MRNAPIYPATLPLFLAWNGSTLILIRLCRRQYDTMIRDAYGTLVLGPAMQHMGSEINAEYPNLPDELQKYYHALDKKWKIKGPALVKKIKALDYISCCALIDACERFWAGVTAGKESDPKKALD